MLHGQMAKVELEGVFSEVAPALVSIHTILVVERVRADEPCLWGMEELRC